jgi:glucosylceramidase
VVAGWLYWERRRGRLDLTRHFGQLARIVVVSVLAITVASVPAAASKGRSAPVQSATNESSTFQVTVDGRSFSASLPTSSVATYTWTPGSSTVDSWETTTSGTELADKLTQQPALSFGTSKPPLPTITVDPSTISQTIEGFGGAMTDSSAYLINHSPKKSEILSALFGGSGADFNMARLPLGASDFIANPKPTCSQDSPKCYAPSPKCDSSKATPTADCFQTYDNTPNDTLLFDKPESNVSKPDPNFSIAHDMSNIVPVLKTAKALNSNFEVIALPWSAPGWMKISGHFLSSCGGSSDFLKPTDYALYAAYLTRAAKAYQDEGLPFSILSMQNEPHNCNPTYPTMMMEPSDQAKLSLDLSADLNNSANGLMTPVPQIMGWDHNWYDYNNKSSSTKCKEQTEASYPESLLVLPNAVSDIGYHSYCGNSSVQTDLTSYLALHKLPPVGIYVTESTGFTAASNSAANLVFEVKNDLIDPIRNGATASLYWNFALDRGCGPQFGGATTCNTGTSSTYSGCMDCRAMITVNNQNGTFTPNQDYYYWEQFSKFVQHDAKRIASSVVGSLDTAAFKNPNGSIVLVVLSGSTPTTTAPSETWSPTKAPLPAKPGGLVSEFSASCAGAGSCLVSDGTSGLETLSGGTWTSTEAAPLPADAYSPPVAGLESVSCAGAGSCVVAGSYFDTTRVDQGLLETLSDGKWTATKAPPPAAARSYGKPGVALSSVSCVSVGRCFVVGSYGDPLGPSEQGLLETLSDGKWTATEAPLPADANRSLTAALGTVSCASAGSCVAAGFYNATSVIGQGLLETLSDGKWTATEAPLPADANRDFVASLGQVSCAVAGNCVAVGLYNYNPGPKTGNWLGQGLLETLSDGTWTATKAPLPADASSYSYPNADLYSVSCAGAGSCVAVGSYDHIGSLNGSGQGLLETLSDGKWTATKAPLPADASSYSSTTPPGANLYSVSCAGAGSCVAVGAYDLFGSDLGQGLLETLSDGKWTAIKAPVPAGGNVAALFSVSCSENGSCAAAGSYAGEGNSQDFLEALSGGTTSVTTPTTTTVTTTSTEPGSGVKVTVDAQNVKLAADPSKSADVGLLAIVTRSGGTPLAGATVHRAPGGHRYHQRRIGSTTGTGGATSRCGAFRNET